jgi:hypothetical protein
MSTFRRDWLRKNSPMLPRPPPSFVILVFTAAALSGGHITRCSK